MYSTSCSSSNRNRSSKSGWVFIQELPCLKPQGLERIEALDIALIDPHDEWDVPIDKFKKYDDIESQIPLKLKGPGLFAVNVSTDKLEATAMVLVPFLLVVKQPDLGTALVYPALLLAMLYWRGLDEGRMILILSPLVSAFLTVYSQSALRSGSYPVLLLAFFVGILVIAYRNRERIFQSILLVSVNLSVMLVILPISL